MTLTWTEERGVLRLRPRGGARALDLETVRRLRAPALSLVDGRRDVVFDLGDIEFIDSAGLGLLVRLFKTVRDAGRQAVFIRARPAVRRVMRVIKLDEIFELHDDLESALRALSREAAPSR